MEKEAVIGFLGGIVVGAIGTFIFLDRKYKKVVDDVSRDYDEYCDSLEEELAHHCEDCQIKNSDIIVDDDDYEDDDEDDYPDYDRDTLVAMLNAAATEDEDSDEDPVDIDSIRDENGIVSYDKISAKKAEKQAKNAKNEEKSEKNEDSEDENEDSDSSEELEEREQDQYLEEDEMDEPVISFITQDEYNDDEEYDKLELTYLEESDIFLTEDNEKYNAYPAIGGRQVLQDGFEECGNGSLYIRNDTLEMNFFIVSDIRDYDTYIKETSRKKKG